MVKLAAPHAVAEVEVVFGIAIIAKACDEKAIGKVTERAEENAPHCSISS